MPADDGVEGAGGDGVEDLRDQAKEAEVGVAVAGGPVAVELAPSGRTLLGVGVAWGWALRFRDGSVAAWGEGMVVASGISELEPKPEPAPTIFRASENFV